MPRAEAQKNYFTFNKGLITEASPLTYPENSSFAEDNFNLLQNGSRTRRFGIDLEDTSLTATPEEETNTYAESGAVTSHEWNSVAGDGDINFLIVQMYTKIFIYDLGADLLTESAKTEFSLSTYAAPMATNVGIEPIQTSQGKGKLFITSAQIEPLLVIYDKDLDTFSISEIVVEVRDFEGINDGVDVTTYPATLSSTHKYNLRNQGWPKLADMGKQNGNVLVNNTNTLTYYYTYSANHSSTYPNKATQFSSGQLAGGDNNGYRTLVDIVDRFTNDTNAPSPNGHFVLNIFDKERYADEVLAEQVTEDNRFETTTFFSGRVWYAGINSSTLNGHILFSQIIDDDTKIGKCYQVADPTYGDDPALVATDGGEIIIPDAGKVLKLLSVGSSVVVFATEGVWEISGGDIGFTALDYTVRKVTDVGCASARSVVQVEGAPLFWSEEGIFALIADQATGYLQANSTTQKTIQTLYNEVSTVAKSYSVGRYDNISKKILWLYNDTSGYDGSTLAYKYNRVLIFDITLASWSTYTISSIDTTDNMWVAGLFNSGTTYSAEQALSVVDGVDSITSSAGADNVVVTEAYSTSKIGEINFVVVGKNFNSFGNSSIFFGTFKNTDFEDWPTNKYYSDATTSTVATSGVDAAGYMETGYELLEDAARDKQATYINLFFNRTEQNFTATGYDFPSGCLVQARWEWADHANSGRWGNQFQGYKFKRAYAGESGDPFTNGFPVVVTKNKIRGKGPALQLRFDTEAGKDCQLLGWAIPFTGNRRV